MNRLLVPLATAITLLGSVVYAADCTADREALLALDTKTFDSTPQQGWRVIGERDGCENLGAELIADYRTRHAPTLNPDEVDGLLWHEAQLRALAGDYDRAVPLFEPSTHSRYPANAIYADATIAFLKKDHPALLGARRHLAALPVPKDFEIGAAKYKAQTGKTLSWPLNLDIVDGLIACFDKPYRQAYGFACRPEGKDVS